jgi:hypothetical protein
MLLFCSYNYFIPVNNLCVPWQASEMYLVLWHDCYILSSTQEQIALR